ncbi:MAG: SsrA-binding protein [Magnetovibrio sp.]|nr:SsrA-binding protein [Magnetovibrio sp.]
MASKHKAPRGTTIAQNRRARRDYNILETFEAGIILAGTEVKSLRSGRASINEAFASEKGEEFWLFNLHIPIYKAASKIENHNPTRPRKLLLHRKEINKLKGAVQRKGLTLIPLSIYFSNRGLAKTQLALGQGKKSVDKREHIKQRDWQRDKARLMRNKS